MFKKHLDNKNKSYNPCEAPGQALRGKLWKKHTKKRMTENYVRNISTMYISQSLTSMVSKIMKLCDYGEAKKEIQIDYK